MAINLAPSPLEAHSERGKRELKNDFETFEWRWRYAVFPSLILFTLLVSFLFYLIYGMLQRMQDLAEDIDQMTTVLSETMPVMQGGVVAMSSRMQWVGDDLKEMSGSVARMRSTVEGTLPGMESSMYVMSNDISGMSNSTRDMAQTTYNMGHNLSELNHNVSGPLSAVNKFIPWKSKTAPPPPRPAYRYFQ